MILVEKGHILNSPRGKLWGKNKRSTKLMVVSVNKGRVIPSDLTSKFFNNHKKFSREFLNTVKCINKEDERQGQFNSVNRLVKTCEQTTNLTLPKIRDYELYPNPHP